MFIRRSFYNLDKTEANELGECPKSNSAGVTEASL